MEPLPPPGVNTNSNLYHNREPPTQIKIKPILIIPETYNPNQNQIHQNKSSLSPLFFFSPSRSWQKETLNTIWTSGLTRPHTLPLSFVSKPQSRTSNPNQNQIHQYLSSLSPLSFSDLTLKARRINNNIEEPAQDKPQLQEERKTPNQMKERKKQLYPCIYCHPFNHIYILSINDSGGHVPPTCKKKK